MSKSDIDKQVDKLNLCNCTHICFGHDDLRNEIKDLTHQIYSQAKAEQREEIIKQERTKLKQAVELWMDTHERNQTTFQTDDFIKFVTEGE